MNKDLYGHKVSIPEEVIIYLGKCNDSAVNADKNTEGYKRNQELRNSKEVTYQQLKRMKNWFDNFKGNNNDLSFILNGGDYVKKWVDNTLRNMRDDISGTKKHTSVVLPNRFNDEHTKDNIKDMNRPSKSHGDSLNYYGLKITENLERINEIIKKIT